MRSLLTKNYSQIVGVSDDITFRNLEMNGKSLTVDIRVFSNWCDISNYNKMIIHLNNFIIIFANFLNPVWKKHITKCGGSTNSS